MICRQCSGQVALAVVLVLLGRELASTKTISLHKIHRQHVDSEAGKVALFNSSLFGRHQSISHLTKQALVDIMFFFLGLQSVHVGVCVAVASRFLVDTMSASVWRSVPAICHGS